MTKKKYTEESNQQEEKLENVSEETNDKAEKDTEKKLCKEDELAQKVKTLEVEIQEQKDKYLRLFAEFDNYRRRTAKEKLEISSLASSNIILKLLPIIDDFERAQTAFEKKEDLASFREGMLLIADKLGKMLEKEGVKKIDSLHKDFDTDEHEAITRIPAPSKKLKGKVVDTIEHGYKLNDKIIRYAKVVVGD